MTRKRSEKNPPQQDTSPAPAQESDVHSPHPLEVMRSAYQQLEIAFDEDDGMISTRLTLDHVEVQVLSGGEPDDLTTVIVRLPVRATKKFRAAAGEFLHRLNYGAKRKIWEIDHNDGEIRLAGYTDTLSGPLTESTFHALLHFMVMTADQVFPCLTSVLSGRMTPEFAADQAAAALIALSDQGKKRKGK